MASSPSRSVGWWLLLVAAAVFVQVGLGGITRLTDSGLSITEWKPLLGVIPPLDEAGWAEAFARYQQIPQYVQLKSHLSPEEFRFIYFWEWFHRLWGRLLGLFFGVPLLVFWRRGAIEGLERRLLALLVLGGLQGVLGWFMVASGLQNLVYVSHLRLAAHLMLALFLLCALVWTGLGVLQPVTTPDVKLHRAGWVLLGLLAVQLTWGAFMAGLKAVLMAPTWPDINGQWLPSAVWSELPWQHPLSVHFIHRTLGYGLLIAFAVFWWVSRRALSWQRHAVLGLALVQVVLGVVTVIYSTQPGALLWLGLAHQLTGTALLASLVAATHTLKPLPASHASQGEGVPIV
ncbi:MAG: COX15/CtaA family protein [Archangium sp.]|nr:COX15/CtaA family protein [Archangium sp.]